MSNILSIYNVKKPTKSQAFEIGYDLLQEIESRGFILSDDLEKLYQLVAYFRPDPAKKTERC